MKGIIGAVAVVLALGCTPVETPKAEKAREVFVRIDTEFSGDQRARLLSAIDTWNYTFNGQIRLIPVTDEQNVVIVREVSPSFPGPDGATAWADQIGGHEIYIRSDTSADFLTPVGLHEFGHIFGAYHVDGTLMNPIVSPTMRCVDTTTGSSVAAFLRLDPNSLQTCPESK